LPDASARWKGKVTNDNFGAEPRLQESTKTSGATRMSDDSSYYVYVFKDPRTSPVLPFYVGKGTGTRSFDHLVRADSTRKGVRI